MKMTGKLINELFQLKYKYLMLNKFLIIKGYMKSTLCYWPSTMNLNVRNDTLSMIAVARSSVVL